mmetsp:Transcript_15254/g.29312  ORF Transcript_15254/g.29312 Transcript_15254/m.29312 type:complete len:387 (+) Transcript_15254:1409-2569(+)
MGICAVPPRPASILSRLEMSPGAGWVCLCRTSTTFCVLPTSSVPDQGESGARSAHGGISVTVHCMGAWPVLEIETETPLPPARGLGPSTAITGFSGAGGGGGGEVISGCASSSGGGGGTSSLPLTTTSKALPPASPTTSELASSPVPLCASSPSTSGGGGGGLGVSSKLWGDSPDCDEVAFGSLAGSDASGVGDCVGEDVADAPPGLLVGEYEAFIMAGLGAGSPPPTSSSTCGEGGLSDGVDRFDGGDEGDGFDGGDEGAGVDGGDGCGEGGDSGDAGGGVAPAETETFWEVCDPVEVSLVCETFPSATAGGGSAGAPPTSSGIVVGDEEMESDEEFSMDSEALDSDTGPGGSGGAEAAFSAAASAAALAAASLAEWGKCAACVP